MVQELEANLDNILIIFNEEEIKTGIAFSPVVKSLEISEKEKKNFTLLFYINIKRDGKLRFHFISSNLRRLHSNRQM